MATLAIHLQEGFNDDTVILQINGAEVFRKEKVKTKLMLGLADDSFQTEVRPGSISLEVAVPTRNITAAIPLEADMDTYVGISIVNNRIEYKIQREPFGYM
jgi:hypothetical protein